MAVKTKRKKNPITDGTMSQLKLSVTNLAKRQAHQAKQQFTYDELLSLFIQPEHRKMLKGAYEIAAPSGVSMSLFVARKVEQATVGWCPLDFSWTSSAEGAFFPPKGNTISQPILTVQDDCPPDLRERYEQTIDDLSDISRRFGEVIWVLDQLNDVDVCPSAAAIRYYWPAFLTLLKDAANRFAGALGESARQLEYPDPRAGSKARVPWYLLQSLKHTNETVATGLLVEPQSAPTLPVNYRVRGVQYEARSEQNGLVIYKYSGIDL